ncbi:DegT/DnrJ/EryC1/StrS family aminotransferase [Azospirillum soli]|uniref:DegT/DnrJ/EryC1/StrS family aminotransferase n=1 Tax=Azospirillum soli TaxID=1304799 RepID=UPI001AE18B94|nr:aminotransferase class I/II-fold pyridoxal phosphate-dependent enzyme [Azospirillum soli]MBP2316239.1 CDP-6-deoxy-D-xylo-4-hexulose-3-dehydrase [Azospirillum soli]
MTENKLQAVHDAVRAYCAKAFDFSFDPANPIVRLHEPTFEAEEIIAALDCLLTTRVTMGPKVLEFENAFAAAHGYRNAVMVNSGSSANLLAIAALVNPALPDALKPGDEVIVPALSWSTTVWPLVQFGLVPVFVDMDPDTLNMDMAEVERAIGPRTRAIMPVHVYGNPCDMDALTDIVKRHNLVLVEDCCEALGARFRDRPVGTFGRVGTFSFYYSHHITTVEGGMCVTDDDELAELMRILRAHGWIREVKDRERWLRQYPDIDPRFLFVNAGFNLRASELQGAMGLIQLPKLPAFVQGRRTTHAFFTEALTGFSDKIRVQKQTPNSFSSCFGFAVTLRDSSGLSRQKITAALNAANIETRPIICGNIARQPGMQLFQHRTVGDLPHATHSMHHSFSFGNHQFVDETACTYIVKVLSEALRSGAAI